MGREDASNLAGRRLQDGSEPGGGGLQQADELAAQFVQRRQAGQFPDLSRIKLPTGETASNDRELIVAVGKLDHDLCRRDRIARKRYSRRPGEQRSQWLECGTDKSALGEAVLGHPEARSSAAHLPPQLGRLGDIKPRLMRDDDAFYLGKIPLQRLDHLLFRCPIHSLLLRALLANLERASARIR
jgi:hypothetical protein